MTPADEDSGRKKRSRARRTPPRKANDDEFVIERDISAIPTVSDSEVFTPLSPASVEEGDSVQPVILNEADKTDPPPEDKATIGPGSEKESGPGFLRLLAGKRNRLEDKKSEESSELRRLRKLAKEPQKVPDDVSRVKSRSALERFAYTHIAKRLPQFPGYKEVYEQSGIPLIYDSYLSTAFLVSGLLALPAFLISLFLESRFLHLNVYFEIIGSVVLGGVAFGISLQVWLIYPLQRRNNFKTRLDNQLAYSFGILGVLSAAGLNIERLIEKLATSESNPVLAGLARRFLRDVKVFGLDTESALREVAQHSPSTAFSKMLESIAIAFRTTGSIHDLVMFESSRLFEEKKEKLTKVVGNLSLMAELYITLIVVGPIIFIVMMAIFGLLPSGGLPDPILVINVITFVVVPVISVMFVLMLDSLVAKT